MSLRAGGGATKKMFWLSLSKSLAPDPINFSGPYFPCPLEEPYKSILLNTVQFRISVNAHVYSVLNDSVKQL